MLRLFYNQSKFVAVLLKKAVFFILSKISESIVPSVFCSLAVVDGMQQVPDYYIFI